MIGQALAALLDEFHPATVVYSMLAERLARRLFVIEESLVEDRAKREPVSIEIVSSC